jgi:hypothetical protein
MQQFHWPEKQSGVVLAFRRINSQQSTKTVCLCGLDPDARYEVTGLGPKSKPPQAVTGKVLLDEGLTIAIPTKAVHAAAPSHTALKYRKLQDCRLK